MKVKATRAGGYYGHKLRHEGEKFELDTIEGKKVTATGKLVPHVFTPEEQFSSTWMEKLGDSKGKAKAKPGPEPEEEDEASEPEPPVAAKSKAKSTGDASVI